MNKFVALAAAGTLAVIASLGVTAQSQAVYPGDGFAAGVAGFMAGAALAGAADHGYYHHDYYRGEDWRDHVDACRANYRTYSTSDDSYTRSFDSDGAPIRVPCDL
jgi:hypothetical protein